MSSAERRWQRFKVDFRVRLRMVEEPEETGSVVRTFEMSEGGMSVYAPQGIEIGAAVMLSFTLEKPMQLRAAVRSLRGFRIGLEFLEVTPAQRSEIARYLGTMAKAAEEAE